MHPSAPLWSRFYSPDTASSSNELRPSSLSLSEILPTHHLSLSLVPPMPPTLLPPQPSPSPWATNPYLLATTRILIIIGSSYLLRSLYQLICYSLCPRSGPGHDVEVEENINLDLDGGGAHVAIIDDLGLGGEGIDGGDLGIRMPLPCHHLRGWR